MASVMRLILYLNFRQAFLTNVMPFYEQPIRGSVCFLRANRSKALTNIRAPGELQLSVGLLYICTSVNTTWRTAGLIHDFIERAEPTPTFFTRYQYYADSE